MHKMLQNIAKFWLKTAAVEEEELQARQTSDAEKRTHSRTPPNTHTYVCTLAGSKISNKFLPKDKYLCPPTKRGKLNETKSSLPPSHPSPPLPFSSPLLDESGVKQMQNLCARLHRLALGVQKWAT